VIVALALGLALAIQAFLVKPYRIPSQSMEPTLDVGQRVLVNRVLYHLRDPRQGDIAVFHPPSGSTDNECGNPGIAAEQDSGEGAWHTACNRPTRKRLDSNFIKRIVAGPGDLLRIEKGQAIVNGKVVRKGKQLPCGSANVCNLPETIRIPPDHYFMMGDNRGESDDSRYWGPVPRDWIIGKTFFTYWPPKRIGIP
jgi:signal peptidase I